MLPWIVFYRSSQFTWKLSGCVWFICEKGFLSLPVIVDHKAYVVFGWPIILSRMRHFWWLSISVQQIPINSPIKSKKRFTISSLALNTCVTIADSLLEAKQKTSIEGCCRGSGSGCCVSLCNPSVARLLLLAARLWKLSPLTKIPCRRLPDKDGQLKN